VTAGKPDGVLYAPMDKTVSGVLVRDGSKNPAEVYVVLRKGLRRDMRQDVVDRLMEESTARSA
jgi:hypothetical protein